MSVKDEFDHMQIRHLIGVRDDYIRYMKEHGESVAFRARVNDIEMALKPSEKAVKGIYY